MVGSKKKQFSFHLKNLFSLSHLLFFPSILISGNLKKNKERKKQKKKYIEKVFPILTLFFSALGYWNERKEWTHMNGMVERAAAAPVLKEALSVCFFRFIFSSSFVLKWKRVDFLSYRKEKWKWKCQEWMEIFFLLLSTLMAWKHETKEFFFHSFQVYFYFFLPFFTPNVTYWEKWGIFQVRLFIYYLKWDFSFFSFLFHFNSKSVFFLI